MKCKQCGREMRTSSVVPNMRAKYCSSKCKQAAYRNKRNVTPVTVTDKPGQKSDTKVGQDDKLTVDKIVEIRDAMVGAITGPISPVDFNTLLDSLPPNVVEPTGLPTAKTQAMGGDRLSRSLVGVKNWQGTAEYAEVCYRLLTGKTEGMNLPGWAVA